MSFEAKIYDIRTERYKRQESLINLEIAEALVALGNLAVKYYQETGQVLSLIGQTELKDGFWQYRLNSPVAEYKFSLEDGIA